MTDNNTPSFDDFKEGWDGLTEDGQAPEVVATTEQTPEPESPAAATPAATPAAEPTQLNQDARPEDVSDETVEKMRGEQSWMQELQTNIVDWVDNTFQGDQRTREEIQEERIRTRAAGSERMQANVESMTNDGGLGEFTDNTVGEATRAVLGAGTDLVEGIVNTADLVGDTGLTILGIAEEKDNPWSDEYEALEFSLGMAENKTFVGSLVRQGLGLYLGMGLGGRVLPGLTNATRASRVGRLANEFGRGAFADLLLAADGENLSNTIEEFFPGQADSWITALSIDEDDNPWEARIKNIVEGGIFGTAVDGIGELIGAARAGRRAAAAARAAGKADDVVAKEASEAAAEYAVRQMELDLEGASARPGKETRLEVQKRLQADEDGVSLINPDEAAIRNTEYPAQQAAKSQFEADDARALGRVSSTPLLTDKAMKKVLQPMRGKGVAKEALEGLRETIVEVGSSIDVDALSRELGQTNNETVARAFVAVRNFIGDTADVDDALRRFEAGEDVLQSFDELTFTTRNGNKVAEREGVVALKTLLSDTAYQINDLATNWNDIVAGGGDAYRQSEMLFDRLGALLRLHKQSSIHYAGGLQSFRIGGLKIGNSQSALTKQLADMDDQLIKMKGLLEKGDPKSMAEMKALVSGLAVSGGDPNKVMSFWALWRRLGGRGAMKSMYNSMLSGPLTQMRNVMGNTFTAVLRPMAIATGSLLSGDVAGARIAMGAYHGLNESVWEALQVGFSSLKTGVPVNEGSKVLSQTAEVAKELKLLQQQATTPAEQAAASFMVHTHAVLDSPWLDYPTRSLSATDDAFKTLIARMEMKRQVFEKSFKAGDGIKFDVDAYAKMADEAFGLNGEILDQKLLGIAKQGTFQTDLKGNMAVISQLSESSPIFKLMMPFVKTPHNIMVYSASFMPGLNRFLSEAQAIRNGTDEVAKRELAGRVGIGYMTIAAGFGLVAAGAITGNGPADPEENKIWRRKNQPMSIKVGGKWVSYASIDPLNTIMPMVADLAYAQQYLTRGEMDNLLGQFAWTLANATYNRSYFQGLGEAVQFVNPSNLTNGKFIQKLLASKLNNFIPLAGPRRSLGKALNPYLYEFNNEFQRVMGNANPGKETFGGVRRVDIFTGEEVKDARMDGFWGVVNSFLPFSVVDVKDDRVITELSDKGVDVPTVFADTDLRGVELNPQQRAVINKYMAEYGLHKNLNKLMDKPWFKEDYQDWLSKVENGTTKVKKEDTRWYKAIVGEFRDAKKSAVTRFQREDEAFDLQVRKARQQEYRAGMGNYQSVDTSGDASVDGFDLTTMPN